MKTHRGCECVCLRSAEIIITTKKQQQQRCLSVAIASTVRTVGLIRCYLLSAHVDLRFGVLCVHSFACCLLFVHAINVANGRNNTGTTHQLEYCMLTLIWSNALLCRLVCSRLSWTTDLFQFSFLSLYLFYIQNIVCLLCCRRRKREFFFLHLFYYIRLRRICFVFVFVIKKKKRKI